MLTLHNVFEKQIEHPTRSRVVRLQGGRSTTGMVALYGPSQSFLHSSNIQRVRFPYSHQRERKILCVLIQKRGLVFHWVLQSRASRIFETSASVARGYCVKSYGTGRIAKGTGRIAKGLGKARHLSPEMRFLQQPPQLNRFTKPWILFVV